MKKNFTTNEHYILMCTSKTETEPGININIHLFHCRSKEKFSLFKNVNYTLILFCSKYYTLIQKQKTQPHHKSKSWSVFSWFFNFYLLSSDRGLDPIPHPSFNSLTQILNKCCGAVQCSAGGLILYHYGGTRHIHHKQLVKHNSKGIL